MTYRMLAFRRVKNDIRSKMRRDKLPKSLTLLYAACKGDLNTKEKRNINRAWLEIETYSVESILKMYARE